MKSTAIVIGGAGALGKALIHELTKASITAISIDMFRNDEATHNLLVRKDSTLSSQYKGLRGDLDKKLSGTTTKGVFCTAGGWMGGGIGDDHFLDVLQRMNSMNLETAALASNLAINYLDNHGTLILTGAQAALQPCPGMIGYGISKSATHYLLATIIRDEKFLQKSCRAYGILPSTIDTPSNRAAMPTANFLSWTKVNFTNL